MVALLPKNRSKVPFQLSINGERPRVSVLFKVESYLHMSGLSLIRAPCLGIQFRGAETSKKSSLKKQ
jgi:hypothetical protein